MEKIENIDEKSKNITSSQLNTSTLTENLLNYTEKSMLNMQKNFNVPSPLENEEHGSEKMKSPCCEELKQLCDESEVIEDELSKLVDSAKRFADNVQVEARNIGLQVKNLSNTCTKSDEHISYESKNEVEIQGTAITASDRISDEKSTNGNSNTINSVSFDETNIEMLPNDKLDDQNDLNSTENSSLETSKNNMKPSTILSTIFDGITGSKKAEDKDSDLATIDAHPGDNTSQRNLIGFVDFRAASEEAHKLNVQLESAKQLAVKTKQLTQEAFEAIGDLSMEGKKHKTSLVQNLEGSEKSVSVVSNYIDNAKNSGFAVLGPNLTYMEKVKGTFSRYAGRKLYLFSSTTGIGIGCGYMIGMIFKKIVNKIKSKKK